MQFTYGDDGLHPDRMENNNRPIDLHRLRLHVSQTVPCPNEALLLGDQLTEQVNAILVDEAVVETQSVSSDVLVKEIKDYFLSLSAEHKRSLSSDSDHRVSSSCQVSRSQVEAIIKMAFSKFSQSFVEPGEAVGAIGAQSISEPGTQMTLKVSARGADGRS